MRELLIDRLQATAEDAPHAMCAAGLSNAQMWARSGGVASWLITRNFGRTAELIPVGRSDRPDRAAFLLGALRAGAAVIIRADSIPLELDGVSFAALARCPVDAAVAERRLQLTAETPAQWRGGKCFSHGDLVTMAQALA